MRAHFLQHVPYEGLGSLCDWLQTRGFEVSCTRLYAGDGLPRPDSLDLVIVMGGPMGVADEAAYPWLIPEKRFLDVVLGLPVPVVGICLGAQLLAERLGARVYPNTEKEIGWFPVERSAAGAASALAESLPPRFMAFHWHGDTFEMPADAEHLASTPACRNQAFLYQRRVLGLQYHLEMTREGAHALIDCNAHELVDAPYIQTADAILGEGAHFEATREQLFTLMDRFMAVNAESEIA